jgi:hypothetical protein
MNRPLKDTSSEVLCKNISQSEVQEMIVRLFDVIMNQDKEIQKLKQSVEKLQKPQTNGEKRSPYMPCKIKDLLY